jgi:hypothetical protein
MKILQLQLKDDNSPLATSLEQHFRAFEYLTCWTHHAPGETKHFFVWQRESNQIEKYEMVPYVINHYRVVDTLHNLYDILKAIFPEECTVDPHLPAPLQCQQKKYVNCKHGADCKHNGLSQGCKFRHADVHDQHHDAELAQDYPNERSRYFDTFHRQALHCCRYGLKCNSRCGYHHHSNCTCAAEYLARTNSSGSDSPICSLNGSYSSDCTDEYDGDVRPDSSCSGGTTVEAFDSDWTVVGKKTITTSTTATASVFNKGAKGRKVFKSSTVLLPLLPTLTISGTTATVKATTSMALPSWCDKTKSTSACRLEKLGPKTTTTK